MDASNECQQGEIAPRTIKFCMILRKADDESKYVGTSAMASSINNKRYVITAKNVA